MALLLGAVLPMPAAAADATLSTASTLPPLGIHMSAVGDLAAAGATPRYGSYWVGPWMATSGWTGLDAALDKGRATGVTPVVYWYYWGDSISPSCVENGCDGRTKAQWAEMTTTLAQHLRDRMGGEEVLVVLENEFNKGGIPHVDYAPTFDGYLETIAHELKAVPGVRIVLGFGAWGENSWERFPRAIAASEYVGFQTMRASTRHTEDQYRDASDRIMYLASFVAQKFDKPSFLYDLALSSYPDAHWEQLQKEELDDVFTSISTGDATGLQGVVYRSLKDNPNMGLHNYFGYAERHWGLWYAYDGGGKPVWQVWLGHSGGGPTPLAESNVPGAVEAEDFTSKSVGGSFADHTASGGRGWMLWSNGEIRQTLQSDDAQRVRVTMTARADLAAGVGAATQLRMNDFVIHSFQVDATTWTTYVHEMDVPAGANSLSIRFTNDLNKDGEDRNLRVDKMVIESLHVNAAPSASFAASGANLSWSFDASASSDADGDALTYAWDFGDGSAAAMGVTANHTYAAAGTYNVTLTVSDGALASSAQQAVTAAQPKRAPVASFVASGENFTFRFDAAGSSDADGDALTYAWDLGDGGQAEGVNVTHTYAAAGTYTVALEVSDGELFGTASADVAAAQANRAPTAEFSAHVELLTVSVDAANSSDPDGDALTYAWDFGDGSNATGPQASHAYAEGGAYRVTLVVTDGELNVTAQQDVTAVPANRAPVANFTASGQDLAYVFDASASNDPDGDALTYAWDLGDGTTASGAVVAHNYTIAGDYVVRLVVSDTALENATEAIVQAHPNTAPSASFTAAGENLTFSFDASGSSDADGDALTYAWDFGDGSAAASGVAVSHTYAAAGTYAVTLLVSDARGATSDQTLEVNATSPPPPSEPVAPVAVTLESENSTSQDNGMRATDTAASGGKYWFLWSNGGVHHAADVAAGTYAVELRARGDYAEGWPIVELRADGARLAAWTVDSATWKSLHATVTLPEGAREVSLVFTNDLYVDGKDRNARLDVLRMTPVALAPAQFEAEDATRKDNGASSSHSGASGGHVWLLWSNGGLHQDLTLAAGKYRVDVVATGDEGRGWPAMDIRMDGQTLSSHSVDPSKLATYSTEVVVGSDGKHTVSVHFTNDARAKGWDRNLRVDLVTLTPIG